VLFDERSGSGPDCFTPGRYIPAARSWSGGRAERRSPEAWRGARAVQARSAGCLQTNTITSNDHNIYTIYNVLLNAYALADSGQIVTNLNIKLINKK